VAIYQNEAQQEVHGQDLDEDLDQDQEQQEPVNGDDQVMEDQTDRQDQHQPPVNQAGLLSPSSAVAKEDHPAKLD